MQFRQKSESKSGAREVVVVNDITATKEILNMLPRDNREDGMRASQELARPQHVRLNDVKVKIPLRRDHWGTLLAQGGLGSCFTVLSHPGTQRLLYRDPRRLGYCSRWWQTFASTM